MRKLLCVLCLLMLPICVASAEEPQLNISGPDAIYERDYFLLDVRVSSDQVTGVAFTLTYDTEHLVFTTMDASVSQGWEGKPVANRFRFTAGEERSDAIAALEFHLRSAVPETVVWVAFEDVVLTIGQTEHHLGTIRWEHKVDRPISGDNYLSSLKISDGVLSPAFSPSQLNYTATVSYHIASVDVTAAARDSHAHVAVNSPALTPDGVTNVTVTVTAEDGSQRVYSIAVTRQDDPNRPLSSDCMLSQLTVTNFMLSPTFDPKVTDYVIWLPYEVTSVEILGTARDPRASVKVEGNKGLKAGKDNLITVTCIAEDGSEMIYTVIAKRAEPYVPETTAPPTEASFATEITSEPIPTEPEIPVDSQVQIPNWAYITIAVAAVTGAAAVGILVSERKK